MQPVEEEGVRIRSDVHVSGPSGGGKSTLCSWLEEAGIPAYDTDLFLQPGMSIWEELNAAYGDETLSEDVKFALWDLAKRDGMERVRAELGWPSRIVWCGLSNHHAPPGFSGFWEMPDFVVEKYFIDISDETLVNRYRERLERWIWDVPQDEVAILDRERAFEDLACFDPDVILRWAEKEKRMHLKRGYRLVSQVDILGTLVAQRDRPD